LKKAKNILSDALTVRQLLLTKQRFCFCFIYLFIYLFVCFGDRTLTTKLVVGFSSGSAGCSVCRKRVNRAKLNSNGALKMVKAR